VASATAGTKGFLFCDLRGYAAFVEHAGDRAGAELLEAYRTLVRLDAPATGIAIGPASLWLLDDGLTRTVREVDPGSGRTIGTVRVGGLPGEAAFAGGSIWVTVHAP
jgi:hypothetical protein